MVLSSPSPTVSQHLAGLDLLEAPRGRLRAGKREKFLSGRLGRAWPREMGDVPWLAPPEGRLFRALSTLLCLGMSLLAAGVPKGGL